MSQSKQRVIIVDLDGTLANCEHRVHHLHSREKDWDAFYAALSKDSLNTWCKELMDAMSGRGVPAIVVTGRGEEYREETEAWLKKYDITYQMMFMRAKLDRRSDCKVKESIYLEEIQEKYEVLFVLDDRKSVVKKWRELGLVCLQCDWGDF